VQVHAAIGLPWRKPAEIEHESGEGPLRNWISFSRFSGGHFVDQHVQAIDRAVWTMGDMAPLMAEDIAGTPQATAWAPCRRPGAAHDNESIDRRERTADRIFETVVGVTGTCDLVRGAMTGRRSWTAMPGPGPGRFSAAMAALVGGIVSGRRVHDGETMCRSTLMAVMGHTAAVSGRPVTWIELTGGAASFA
jgi:hypothetical protein